MVIRKRRDYIKKAEECIAEAEKYLSQLASENIDSKKVPILMESASTNATLAYAYSNLAVAVEEKK